MLISNFNLYKNEWLDLVFDKRNKEYGAYNIRQHYAENLTRALLISVVVVVGGAVAVGAAIKVEPKLTDKDRVVTVVDISPPSTPPKKEEPVKAELEKPKAAEPIKTRQYVEMVPTATPTDVEPATIDELVNVAVGPANVDGRDNGPKNVLVEPSTSGGPGTDITESTEPLSPGVLSVLPAPVGGDEAWTKFLKRNLRYPDQAVDAEKGGKVWISFVIEKDGTLTDIKIIRGPGYGMDEEALRVLKKAPAWTPGIQRGKPVRVAFTLPINFALQ
ncbi:energy transducer TonB [Mucilaginibacter sp. HD30]